MSKRSNGTSFEMIYRTVLYLILALIMIGIWFLIDSLLLFLGFLVVIIFVVALTTVIHGSLSLNMSNQMGYVGLPEDIVVSKENILHMEYKSKREVVVEFLFKNEVVTEVASIYSIDSKVNLKESWSLVVHEVEKLSGEKEFFAVNIEINKGHLDEFVNSLKNNRGDFN